MSEAVDALFACRDSVDAGCTCFRRDAWATACVSSDAIAWVGVCVVFLEVGEAIKVFGEDGSTDLTAAGVEWAVDPNGDGDLTDRLDVINLSLGADYSVTNGLDPDVLAIVGASAALSLSTIPFDGPVGAVRVGCLDGELVLNPTLTQLASSSLYVVVASTSDALVTLEAGAKDLPD